QFDANTVGIIEEDLGVTGPRHDLLPELDVLRLQPHAHALDVSRGKGDVVEPARILVFLLGAAHHDAFAGLARPHQGHRGLAARVKPVAGEAERRTLAVLQSQYVDIEVLGLLEVLGLDSVVLQSAERHGFSPYWLYPSEVGFGTHHPGADGFEMAEA